MTTETPTLILYSNPRGMLAASLDDGQTVVIPTGRRIPRAPVWEELENQDSSTLTPQAQEALGEWLAEMEARDQWIAGEAQRAQEARDLKAQRAQDFQDQLAARKAARRAWEATPAGQLAVRREREAMDRLFSAVLKMARNLN